MIDEGSECNCVILSAHGPLGLVSCESHSTSCRTAQCRIYRRGAPKIPRLRSRAALRRTSGLEAAPRQWDRMKPAARACRAIRVQRRESRIYRCTRGEFRREGSMTAQACVVPFSYGPPIFSITAGCCDTASRCLPDLQSPRFDVEMPKRARIAAPTRIAAIERAQSGGVRNSGRNVGRVRAAAVSGERWREMPRAPCMAVSRY